MADVVKTITIKVDGKDAVVKLDDIKNALKEVQVESKKVDQARFDNVEKGLNKIANGFKGIGLAMKAAGIGLMIGAFNLLKDALMKNETAVKAVETVMNLIQIVMNQVVDVVVKVWTKVSEMTNGMEDTKKVIGGLITLGLTPLKLIFYQIVLAVKEAQLAWEMSWFGKGDTTKIKELTASIDETRASMKKTGEEALEAGKQVVKNIGGMVGEVVTIVSVAVNEGKKAVSEFDLTKETQRARDIAFNKTLREEAIATAKVLAANAEQEAEKLRQIRDDTTKTYEERKKASTDLLAQLEIEKAAKIDLAQKEYENAAASMSDIEKKKAANELRIKTAEINAQIETQYSEQLRSNVSLLKEETDALKAKTQTLIEGLDISVGGTEEALQKIKELEKKAAAEHLSLLEYVASNTKLSYKDRAAAYKELLDLNAKNDELGVEGKLKREKELNDALLLMKQEHQQKVLELSQAAIDTLKGIDEIATNTQIALLNNKLKNGKISQEQYEKQVEEIRIKAAKREKAYAVSSTIINTAASIMKIWAEVPKGDFGVATILLTVAAGVAGLASIAKILATPVGGAGGGGSAPSTPSVPSTSTAPNTSFSFQQQTPSNLTPAPIRTYVLNKDVQTQQQLDRQIVTNGTM